MPYKNPFTAHIAKHRSSHVAGEGARAVLAKVLCTEPHPQFSSERLDLREIGIGRTNDNVDALRDGALQPIDQGNIPCLTTVHLPVADD